VFGFVPTSLTSHGQTKLRDATDSDRDHHNRPRECRDEQRHGDGHSSAHREKVNTYVTSVLRNEVDERNAKDDGHGDAHPRGRKSGVAKVFSRVLGTTTVFGPRFVT
jgi:hypothetical protein